MTASPTTARALAATLLMLVAAATATAQTDDGLRRCRSQADAAARLACYDALADSVAATRGAGPSGGPAATPPAAAPATARAAQFGLDKPADDLEFIESTIAGRFEGWGARTMFRLSNGQIWQIADDSEAFAMLDNPRVRVRRGALGSYYLEVEGVRRAARVRRIH